MKNQENNLPALQKNQQDLALLEQNKPYVLMLKENNEKWKNVTAEIKEDCLDFMLEILNIKIVDEEDQDAINRQLILVADLISRYFSSLTAEEVKEAMRMYVSKKFAEVKVFRLIDCVSIGEILNAYIEFRNQAIDPFLIKRQNLLNAPVEKSDSEKEKIFEDFVKMVFDEVLKNKFCVDSWYLFKELEEKGKIVKSNEEKQQLYEKELEIFVTDERQRLVKQNPLNKKYALEELVKSYQNGKRPTYVKNRCRSLLVSEFILKSGISFEELLTVLK